MKLNSRFFYFPEEDSRPESKLQEAFLQELLSLIRASRHRIESGLQGGYQDPDEDLSKCFTALSESLSAEEKKNVERIVWDELRTTIHSVLLTMDGESEFSQAGTIHIEDDRGRRFEKSLNELVFKYLSQDELNT